MFVFLGKFNCDTVGNRPFIPLLRHCLLLCCSRTASGVSSSERDVFPLSRSRCPLPPPRERRRREKKGLKRKFWGPDRWPDIFPSSVTWLFCEYMAIFTSSGRTHGDEGPSSSRRRSISDKVKDKDRGTPSWETRASGSTVQNCEGIDQQSPSSNKNFVRVEKKRPRIPLMRPSGSEENVDSSSSGLGEFVAIRKKRLTARSYRASLNRMAQFENMGEGTEAELLLKDDSKTLQSINFTSDGAYSSSSSYPENRLSSQCSTCSKLQREDNDSQLPVFCSCNAKAEWDLSASSENLGGAGMDSTGSAGGNLCVTHLDSSQAIQRDGNHALCIVCKHPGSLLRCDGKGCTAGYHLACLDPPLSEIPHGSWLCFCCLRKKMEFGIYYVSEKIESIWDSKEEMQKERHYLVKYKGLAHFYNRWIPENQLLHEDPMLLAKFNKKHRKYQVNGWKQEWTEPHRVLQKRFLMPPEHENECSCGHGNAFEYCYLEWLVKWKGLGYENATWEFENSPFLCSVEGKTLVNDYERRREEARKASDPSRADKAVLLKDDLFHKLPSLPNGSPSELDNDHLDSTRSILKSWHQRKNAVLIDDQERIVRSILFISKIQPYTCRPFLIISTTSSLSIWEAEFARLAPSINVVVYNGNKSVRKLIQALEFYEEGGCIMFQVLLTCPNFVVEDLEAFDCIGWEAIVIEDCQKLGVSKHFEQFVNLPSEFRLLLLSSQPKDNVVDYVKLLSFLDPRGHGTAVNCSKFDRMNHNDALSILKERLGQYLVYECKQNSSIFTEYWVPVQLSEVQLKQYCSILTSNSHSLRSRVRVDCVESLLDVLVSIRKCCDHPYLADDSLEKSLTKTLPGIEILDEILDIGVNASGKLQLLDKILQEMKNHGLKVLILFQSSIASERNRMGDILYDFLCQRFGDESFGYVDRRKNKSQTEPILQSFNGMGREKFLIVLENRACRSWIKLSSVDAVVIYDSDWNPSNDLKALQKITIDSPVQQVKVFRLYSPYTVEEKVLMLAKNDAVLEGDIENTSIRLRHTLLSWGAAQLFSKLNEFHQPDSGNYHPKPFSDNLLLNDVLDLLTRLPENIDATGDGNCSSIVKAHLSGASYSTSISLYGEKGDCSFDGDQTLFWSNLLETSSPIISGNSPKIRRSIEAPDEFTKRPEAEGYDLEKGKKLCRSTTVLISKETLQCKENQAEGLAKSTAPEQTILCSASQPSSIPTSKAAVADGIHIKKSVRQGASKSQPNVGLRDLASSTVMAIDVTQNRQLSNLSFNSELHNFMKEPLEREKQLDAQKKVQDLLKPELLQLCETLRFPENVKRIADLFLEYILKNYYVCLEPASILQAFILSLCWCAASFSKHEVNHKESLTCAKKYFKFECKEKQVETIYDKLGLLKDNFSSLVGLSANAVELNSLENQLNKPITDAKDLMHNGDSKTALCDDQDVAGEIKECLLSTPANKRLCMKKVQKSAKTENQLRFSEEPTVGHSNPASANLQEMVEEGQLSVPTKDVPKDFLQEGNPKAPASDHQEPEKGESQSHVPSPSDGVAEVLMHDRCSDRLPFDHVDQDEGKIKEDSNIQSCSEQPSSEELLLSLKDKLLEKRKSLIELIYSERLNQLLDLQQVELKEFKDQANLEKQELLRTHCLELDMSSATNTDTEVSDAMRKLQQEFSKKMDQFDQYMKCQRNRLLKMQIEARNKEKQIKDQWLEEAKTGRLTESYEKLPLSAIRFRVEKFKFREQVVVHDDLGNVFSLFGSSSDAIQSVGSIEPTSSSDAVTAIVPNDGMQQMSSEIEMPICNSKILIAVESAEQNRLIFGVSTCNLSGGPGDELLHARTPSSVCNVSSETVVASTEACSEFPAIVPMEESEEIHTVEECPTNQSIGVDVVESVDPSRTSPHVSETVCCEGSGYIPLETEILVSQHEIMNFTYENLDGVGITSRTLAEHHGDVEPEGACLTSSLQSQTNIASISHASNCEGCENSVLHSQVTSVVELETTAVSETVNEPACSVPSDIGIPISDSCDTERLHPVVPLLPPQTGVTSVASGHERRHAHTGSGQEPQDRVHCSAQLNGVSTPSNSSFQSFTLPVVPVSNILPENLQVRHLSSTAVQPEMVSYSQALYAPRQPLSQKELHSDPLRNEISWLRRTENELAQLHVKKKRHLEIECEKELEMVRKKYASLIQDDEADFANHFKNVKKFQSFVDMQRNVAESFRGNLFQNKRGSAVSQGQPSSCMQQFRQLPWSEIAQRSVLASSSVPAPQQNPPFLYSPGLPCASSLVTSVRTPQPHHNDIAVSRSSLARPHRNPMLPYRENLRVRSDFPPQLLHLHPFRSQPNILLQNGQVTNSQDFQLL